MIPYMHPDAVISVLPYTGEETIITDDTGNLFHTYKGPENASRLLNKLRKNFTGPFIFMLSLATEDSTKERKLEYIEAALIAARDEDVVVVEIVNYDIVKFQQLMCQSHPKWLTQYVNGFILFKSVDLIGAPSMQYPAVPKLLDMKVKPACDNAPQTDIILMTRNRPLQTFAFLDSLVNYVSGIHKVWILLRSDEALFQEGYEYLSSCFKDKFQLEILQEAQEGRLLSFGKLLEKALSEMDARYVVLGVDEIIWHRPVDLNYASCLLEEGMGKIASFQLRLGENLGMYDKIKNKEKVFHPLPFDNNVKVFYPRRLPYDFGYVLNVDGTMMKREDLIADFQFDKKSIPSSRYFGKQLDATADFHQESTMAPNVQEERSTE